MRNAVTQLAPFMNRSRGFGSAVASDAAREGEILEERTHSFFIFALARIYLRISPFQVYGAQHAGSAVTGPSEENGVEIIFLDDAIEVNVAKAQSRTRAPVAQ